MWRSLLSLVLVSAVAGCSSHEAASTARRSDLALASFSGAMPGPTQCAPFVREIVGIPIYGNAGTWWDQAAARYPRGSKPQVNSVLVLRATDQLPYGHVAAVRKVLGPRQITVTHADWGNDDPTRRLVHDSMPVIDVSPNNDWTQLRFWNVNTRAYGKVYAAYGFIYPRRTTADAMPIW